MRAYSVLTIKGIDEDRREIVGIATTPALDSVGDVVEPKGAVFKLPIPLLWQHNAGQPIGHVISAKVTPAGIEIKAQMATIAEPGALKDRLDEAWQSIKIGLVRGLSIGFRALEDGVERIASGYRFTKWSWLELSAVTIPANAQATVLAVKTASAAYAASGVTNPPGASGVTKPSIRKGTAMNGIHEQLAELRTQRAEKATRLQEIKESAEGEKRAMSDDEALEFDTLAAEVKGMDDQIRFKQADVFSYQTAKPVHQGTSVEVGQRRNARIETKSNLPPGVAVAQYARIIGLAKGHRYEAEQIAKNMRGLDPRVPMMLKADVSAGSSLSGNWAAALVGEESSAFADFVEYLRPMTITGRFGSGGIPSLRRVPFRTRLVEQETGGNGYWVGEGAAKPLTAFETDSRTITPTKVAAIAVATMELLRDSSPSADLWLRDQLVAALRARMDTDFIDPAITASAGIRPASITNGITAIGSSGTNADAVRADVRALVSTFLAADNTPTSAVFIMPSTTALALSLMTNGLGQPEFPGINMMGGTLSGIPVITSEYVPTVTAGALVILVNASDIYWADEGGFSVDMSQEASLQMNDTGASHNSVTPAAVSLVSMFQTNSVAFRAERTVHWARRRTSAVAVLDDVLWGQGS